MNRKLTAMLLVFIIAASICSAFVYAADSAPNVIRAAMNEGTKTGYNIMRAIVTPIAAAMFAYAAFSMMTGGERNVEAAKKQMIICGICVIVVWLVPFIIGEIMGWVATSSTSYVSSTVRAFQ